MLVCRIKEEIGDYYVEHCFLDFFCDRFNNVYIAVWSAARTLFEQFIAKPFGILLYPGWKIIPWSAVGYVLVLTWEYIYFKLVEKRIKQ